MKKYEIENNIKLFQVVSEPTRYGNTSFFIQAPGDGCYNRPSDCNRTNGERQKRVEAKYKNLKYKKILNILNKVNTSKNDILLYKNKKILETGTSNLLFVKKNKVYSPISGFYLGTTLKYFLKKIKIKKKNIMLNSINEYDEILLIGSGKGVVSVSRIENTKWRRKSFKYHRILLKIYQKAVVKCPRYNG